MSTIKSLFFLAVAVACAFAAEDARVKKDVLLGSPYGAYPYSAGYVAPAAYSAGYVAPAAYSAGYAAAPLAYSAGYAAPAAYSAGYVAPAAYSAYSAYPHAAGYAPALRSGLYY